MFFLSRTAFDARLLRLGPADGSSEITLAVVVNRILERVPDYNPKGASLSCAPTPADLPLQVKCDLPVAHPRRGYETHKSSRVLPRRTSTASLET